MRSGDLLGLMLFCVNRNSIRQKQKALAQGCVPLPFLFSAVGLNFRAQSHTHRSRGLQ
jgi:hypothetical protein